MKFVDAIKKLFATAVSNTSEPKKKSWQEGKPWCTPYANKGRVLWNMDKMHGSYSRKLHGSLTRGKSTPYA